MKRTCLVLFQNPALKRTSAHEEDFVLLTLSLYPFVKDFCKGNARIIDATLLNPIMQSCMHCVCKLGGRGAGRAGGAAPCFYLSFTCASLACKDEDACARRPRLPTTGLWHIHADSRGSQRAVGGTDEGEELKQIGGRDGGVQTKVGWVKKRLPGNAWLLWALSHNARQGQAADQQVRFACSAQLDPTAWLTHMNGRLMLFRAYWVGICCFFLVLWKSKLRRAHRGPGPLDPWSCVRVQCGLTERFFSLKPVQTYTKPVQTYTKHMLTSSNLLTSREGPSEPALLVWTLAWDPQCREPELELSCVFGRNSAHFKPSA